MPRRTVSIPPGMDRAVREYQAQMMRIRNEDVTYTEALVAVLLYGFLQPGRGKTFAFWKDGNPEATQADLKAVLDGYDQSRIRFEGFLDQFPTTGEG